MRTLTLADVARAVSGSVAPASAAGSVARGACVDSRQAAPGDLFFALPGERADGHRFVDGALAQGAAAAVVRPDQLDAGPSRPLVEVEDPARALMDLARVERASMDATVVGITGSTGKTCTKDFLAAALGERFRVAASAASFNNEVGLPLTLLRAPAAAQAIVCEMGSRGPGHIRLLCEIARPQVGVITTVGVAHMELFGSPQALRDAKAELPEALPSQGVAVLNADDPVARAFAGRTPASRVVLFGLDPGADIRAEDLTVSRETGVASFRLVTPDGWAGVRLPVPGEHMVCNALAAAAAGWAMGLGPEEAAAGLEAARISSGRMETFRTPDGVLVIDDSYNANPASVAAALKAARWMADSSRCVAVLGPMAELGPIADQEHERVGEMVARLGIEELVVVGPEARRIAVGAEREGVEPERIVVCADPSEAIRALRAEVRAGDVVLIKASRVAGLERVAAALRQALDGAEA